MESPDVVIAGSGPVGAVLAHALARLAPELSVLQLRGGAAADDRPIALSHGSRLILERLGLWAALPTTPIHRIHVSQRGGFGRTLISASDHGLDALGHVVSYRDLVARSATVHDATGIAARLAAREESLQGWAAVSGGVEVQLATGSLKAKLLILADGGGSRVGEPSQRVKDYHQSAIVCNIETAPAHGNLAWERFTRDGPIALLPFRDRYALVWTVPSAEAERLCALEQESFLAELQRTFGTRAGMFRAVGPRASFPLSLRMHKNRAQPGVIAIGNAAQTLHPVAGQGLNLGLRDAWELAEACTRCHAEAPAQLGGERFVRSFSSRRRLDREIMVRLTDGLIGAFSLRLPFASTARGAALAFLDSVPPARRFLSRRMMFGARAMP